METPSEKRTIAVDKPSILVVEDNDLNAEVVKLYLKQKYQVDWAMTGEAALKMIDKHHYCAILLDINLGVGMNGLEVVWKLRSHLSHASLPVIALTGYTLDEEQQMALVAGCTCCLTKPYSKGELLSLLEKVLSREEDQQEVNG